MGQESDVGAISHEVGLHRAGMNRLYYFSFQLKPKTQIVPRKINMKLVGARHAVPCAVIGRTAVRPYFLSPFFSDF
ncbi:TPA: hypothetical protein DD712_00385 [Candidatus Acetothermia bacterium]|nr:hypothetical protein [Candidatus Acetothermia bacterium]